MSAIVTFTDDGNVSSEGNMDGGNIEESDTHAVTERKSADSQHNGGRRCDDVRASDLTRRRSNPARR